MASFTFSHMLIFVGRGDGATYQQVIDGPHPRSDGDGDETFEAGDGVGGMWGYETYLGTTVINGERWPVFASNNGANSHVYVNGAPEGTPEPLVVDTAGVYCFAAGTRVATPEGDVAVEALMIGDLVLTADGRSVPVAWLGHQSVAPMFRPVRLIRLAAGALGHGLPLRDLVVTAEHALMLDGLLVNAGALVNGNTVREVAASELPRRVTVYHIETEAHEIILAEGTPVESYIDYAGRRMFDNYAEYVALYGEDRAIVENPAPRVTSARMLPPALRARLGHGLAA